MKYEPDFENHREALGGFVVMKLQKAGFSEDTTCERTKEMVFTRQVKPNVAVKVFTSVVETPNGRLQIRAKDKDAIRVCGVYTNREGKQRGIVKAQARVFRVGQIEEIPERMVTRMREVWVASNRPVSCNKCGAPKFKSKLRKKRGKVISGGNEVCADACWTINN